jgi:holo-[acyl-carrier protein] synthase
MKGIGTDIVDVERLAAKIRRRASFVEMVFSADERRFCEAQARPAQHFAARFAAKEAFLKALGRGVFSGVPLSEIEVVREKGGRPGLRLGPAAAAALGAAGGRQALVSLSHEGGMAIAFVAVG